MQIQPHTVKLPPGALAPQTGASAVKPNSDTDKEGVLQEKFQDAVAGTFYRTMLKALRSTEKKPAYLDGGQAEDIFKGQLDEQFSDLLAKHNGAELSDSLFQVMRQRWRAQAAEGGTPSASSSSVLDNKAGAASDPLQSLIDAVTNSQTEPPPGVPLPKGPASSVRRSQAEGSAAQRSYTTASLQETAHVLNLVG